MAISGRRPPGWPAILGLSLSCLTAAGGSAAPAWGISQTSGKIQITAGVLSREIRVDGGLASTASIRIAGQECLARPAADVTFNVSFASPNRKPKGLAAEDTSALETTAHFSGTDGLREARSVTNHGDSLSWRDQTRLAANAWGPDLRTGEVTISQPAPGRRLLTIPAQGLPNSPLKGLEVRLCFEIYDGFPAVRKWIEVSNAGNLWLKLSNLVVDDFELGTDFKHGEPLTPGERGAGPCVIAFGDPAGRRGLILVNEVPSALRHTAATGAMGYSEELFEWVLGPGERFVSEPVFMLAYSGDTWKTLSAVSTARDRAVEGVYLDFLRRQVGIAADAGPILAPQWCSWSNFGWAINDRVVREQAGIAARCGFVLLLLDSGWQRDTIGTEPDPARFPEFEATGREIRSLGLELGLWVSCFRTADSPDMRALPNARSVPLIKRDGGFGMSFASPWREFYARDLARRSERFGAAYFKQDYTNIKFGDLAEGHESRTRKESLLRGLRGLLESQDLLRRHAPGVVSQITHEIYWGTPGVPCDVAVLKHAAAYHIPPNDYAGVGHPKQRVSDSWAYDPATLRRQLIAGCYNARQRFFAHRGLPLYALEYYAAHTVNFRGSLTAEVQDRQICSWLMGAPAAYAGDLASLTEDQVRHYRRRFDLLKRLEREYSIYRNFQFSGVPGPTDEDWHWWGKLNREGAGAVVVVRGAGGAGKRAINVPWTQTKQAYEVTAALSGKVLGRYSGEALQAGKLTLALPAYGQEILELRLAQ